MARIRSVATQFDVAIEGTKEEIHRRLIDTAKREHANVMKTAPKPGRFKRWVDGSEGKAIEQVREFGVVEFEYYRLDEVVAFALATLIERSPVDSGEYRGAHTLFLNGVAVANLQNWNPGDEISILNPMPYARKIEMGKMKMRVPGHVYEATAKIVSRRFGNMARVKFTYRSAALPYVALGGRKGGKTAGAAKRSAHNIETATRVPALIITEL